MTFSVSLSFFFFTMQEESPANTPNKVIIPSRSKVLKHTSDSVGVCVGSEEEGSVRVSPIANS